MTAALHSLLRHSQALTPLLSVCRSACQLVIRISELIDCEKKKTAYLFPNAVRTRPTQLLLLLLLLLPVAVPSPDVRCSACSIARLS